MRERNIVMKCFGLLIGTLFIFVFSDYSLAQGKKAKKKKAPETLKEVYKDYFPIGVAVTPQSLLTDEADLMVRQFSSLTAENVMKMGPIHPKEKEFFWDDADKIVEF